MFELPDAKRVRRTELHSPHSSPSVSRSPSPSTTAQIQARLAALYGGTSLISQAPLEDSAAIPVTSTDLQPTLDPASNEDGGYEYRLFAGQKHIKSIACAGRDDQEETEAGQTTAGRPGRSKVARVRISSPSPGAEGGGFVKPHRRSGYYFTWAEDDGAIRSAQFYKKRRTENFMESAVCGDTIKHWASQSWPGSALPWRVRLLPRAQFPVEVPEATKDLQRTSSAVTGKKRKPNRKRRIVIRRRIKDKANEEEAKVRRREERGKEEKEKRTRRNREKKVKRKQKEKIKKLVEKGEDQEDRSKRI
ncbi:MAG: hypothetical protein MMC23_007747 [Stictis urceolatum]|nr:hypothetical protein [Stictis urceolata]